MFKFYDSLANQTYVFVVTVYENHWKENKIAFKMFLCRKPNQTKINKFWWLTCKSPLDNTNIVYKSLGFVFITMLQPISSPSIFTCILHPINVHYCDFSQNCLLSRTTKLFILSKLSSFMISVPSERSRPSLSATSNLL